MRRLAALFAIALLACLTCCGAEPRGPGPTGGAPSPTGRSPTVTPVDSPRLAPSATSRPLPSPTAPPTHTPRPTATPTPVPTATLLRSGATGLPRGESYAVSLQGLLTADVHLTAGTAARLAGEPTYVLASLDQNVYATDSGGRLLWRARASGPVYCLAVVGEAWVAAGDDAGMVTLFDARGKRLWLYSLESRVTALAGPWRGGLLAGGWDQRLTLLDFDASGARPRWQVELGSDVSDLAVRGGLAVVSTMDGTVRAFDDAGKEVWRYLAGAPVTRVGDASLADGGSREGGAAEGQPAADEEMAWLIGTQDGRLTALRSDGTLLWQRSFGEGAAGSPVWRVASLRPGEAPHVVAGTGGITPELALLAADGHYVWRAAMPVSVGAIETQDLDADGRQEILVGLSSGQVLALGSEDGHLGAEMHAGLPVWDLQAASDADEPTCLVLASTLAWKTVSRAGAPGKPRLPPPALLATPLDPGELVPAAQGEATLVFLGDVALGRSMELQLARYGPAYPWTGLGPLLRQADLAVANLEGVLTTRGKPMRKPYLIRAHPRWSDALVEAGFDVVALANNHALDLGDQGLDDTLEALAQKGIVTIGAGRSSEEARRPALFTLNGVRIAILAYAGAYWYGSADMPATERIAWSQTAAIEADVRAAREQADVTIVILHAGKEYTSKPSSSQVAAAHAAIEAGAALVVGHHPHVTQTVERYKSGLIVYSLGNAVFDIPCGGCMRGDLLRVTVSQAGVAQAELWPFWIEDGVRPRLLDDGQGQPRVKAIYP